MMTAFLQNSFSNIINIFFRVDDIKITEVGGSSSPLEKKNKLLLRTKMKENLQRFEVEQVERIKKQNEMLANILESAKKKKILNQIKFDLLFADAKKGKNEENNNVIQKKLNFLRNSEEDESEIKRIESKKSVDDFDLLDSLASSISGNEQMGSM